jgi:hypothetical protein
MDTGPLSVSLALWPWTSRYFFPWPWSLGASEVISKGLCNIFPRSNRTSQGLLRPAWHRAASGTASQGQNSFGDTESRESCPVRSQRCYESRQWEVTIAVNFPCGWSLVLLQHWQVVFAPSRVRSSLSSDVYKKSFRTQKPSS